MSSELEVFELDGSQLRTITDEFNVTWFCGRDAAAMLGYVNTKDAIAKHCKGVAKRYPIVDSLGRTQEAVFISEPDLYRLITHSKLPTAERFECWIFEEVLPAIRKTGHYGDLETAWRQLTTPDAIIQMAENWKKDRDARLRLEAEAEANAPKILFADAVATSKTSILIGQFAKILKGNGVDIGQNRLFAWLRDNGYLHKTGRQRNMPTQYAMELGLFEVKESVRQSPDGDPKPVFTTKMTGKGQQYFLQRFVTRAIVDIAGQAA